MTRIFNVEFEYNVIWDGVDIGQEKDNLNVVADDGRVAANKVAEQLFKPHTEEIEDEDTGENKKVKVEYNSIRLIDTTLLAEA